jgi:hypothetical protein
MITTSLDLGPLMKKLRQVPREATRIMTKVVEADAKGFIRDIVAVTPPSQGKANVESKRRGETRVERDIRILFKSKSQAFDSLHSKNPALADLFWQQIRDHDYLAAQETLRMHTTDSKMRDARVVAQPVGTIHQRMRSRRSGGVYANANATLVITSDSELKKYIKINQARVGLLASGFNAAARRLGVKLPAWITRHGTAAGAVSVSSKFLSHSITIANNARHGRGADLPRRIRWVLGSKKRKDRAAGVVKTQVRLALKAARLQTA